MCKTYRILSARTSGATSLPTCSTLPSLCAKLANSPTSPPRKWPNPAKPIKGPSMPSPHSNGFSTYISANTSATKELNTPRACMPEPSSPITTAKPTSRTNKLSKPPSLSLAQNASSTGNWNFPKSSLMNRSGRKMGALMQWWGIRLGALVLINLVLFTSVPTFNQQQEIMIHIRLYLRTRLSTLDSQVELV